MNTKIISGKFHSNTKNYRSRNGHHYFTFNFVDQGSYLNIFCTYHPSINGKDSDPHKTHLFPSGKVCFVEGREPRTQSQAEKMAAQWAEYFLEYRKTGIAQS